MKYKLLLHQYNYIKIYEIGQFLILTYLLQIILLIFIILKLNFFKIKWHKK